MVKVSVVIPVYNRAIEIERAVGSVLQQTMPDWEIILVDDGSNDMATVPVAERFVRRHSKKISLLRHNQNKGVSAARNTGVKAATGEYVAFLDSDDEWRAQKLEKQLASLDRHSGRDAFLCLCNVDVVDKNRGDKIASYASPEVGDVPLPVLGLDILNPCSVMLISRANFNKVGPFDETMNVSEDVDWMLRHILAGGQVTSVPEALSVYRSEIYKSYPDSEQMLNLLRERYGSKIHQKYGLPAYRHFLSGLHYHQLRGMKRKRKYLQAFYHLILVGVCPMRLTKIVFNSIAERL